MMKFYLIKKIKKSSINLKILIFAFLFSFPLFILAQPSYTFSYPPPETYSNLSFPTELLPVFSDDQLSASAPIGFTFAYNGIDTFTTFKVSANGFVNLGGNMQSNGNYNNNLKNTSVKPILAPFWDDLEVDDTPTVGSIGYKLTGTSGSYILKIEFKEMTFWGEYIGMNYQVWLYEGTNVIEFRYGDMGDWTGINASASIGINDEYTNEFLSITPGSTPSSSFLTSNNSISSNTYLTSGLIYRFTPVSPVQWVGTTSTDWGTTSNWNTGIVPVSTDNVLIPTGKSNYPVIDGSGAICQKLVIESGGEITVTTTGDLTVTGNLHINGNMTVKSSETSTSSLIVAGTSSGNMEFQRFLTKDPNWHLISCPVQGQTIADYYTSNSIATNSGEKAITTYNEGIDDWNPYPTGDPGTYFTPGIGYSTLTSSDVVPVSFNGTLNSGDVTGIPVTRSNMGWNLVGNPYSSAINATINADATNNFLSVNSAAMDPGYAAIYLWDPSTAQYKTISNSGGSLSQNYIQSGQGFFIKSKTGGASIDFTKAMQNHQNTAPFKSENKSWPTINITALNGNNKSSTLISFNSKMSLGLDVTYDAGMFKSNPDFSLYSRLVVDNGIDYAIQCLPENYNNLVIPLGIDAPVGTEVTFYAELFNLPEECQPYLEDRIKGKFISLQKPGSSYSVVVDNRYSGIEALFLHTSSTFVTQSEIIEELNEPFKVVTNTTDGFIRVISSDDQSAIAKVYDVSGRIVASREINYGNDNLIYISGSTRSIYYSD